ncbi:hypothetical protein [Brevibacillus sp. H7]|uniref:hypothetical protein n=1 Tax=Brevibacillus sp. H7 TaxID=3349138 RepID=UPI00380BB75A
MRGTIFRRGDDASDEIEDGETKVNAIAPDGDVEEAFTLNDEYPIDGMKLDKNQTVYLVLGTNLYAYQLNGKKKWKTEIDYGLAEMELDKNGMLYVRTYDSLYAISPEGSITWKLNGLNYYSNFALGNDGVIYVSDSESLTAYKTGKAAEEKKVKTLTVNMKSLSITKGKSLTKPHTAKRRFPLR